MLLLTLKSALRWLFKNSLLTTINILGLAISLCVSLFIVLWINRELSVDQFHENRDQLYFISLNHKVQENKYEPGTHTPANLAPFLAERFPQIKNYSRVRGGFDHTFLQHRTKEVRGRGYHADEAFFKIFTFPVLQGDKQKALASPTAIVLTEKLSKALFGEANPLGQTVDLQDAYSKRSFVVSAIIADVPEQSSMKFDYVLPYQEFEARNEWVKGWGNYTLITFLQLREETDLASFEAMISKEVAGVGSFTLGIIPFTKVYLGWPLNVPIEGLAQGNTTYLKIFGGVALFMLLIAGINYINLTTALNFRRVKEAGIKKVLGSENSQLFVQHFLEFGLVLATALLLAAMLMYPLLPYATAHWSISLSLQPLNFYLFYGYLLGLLLIFGMAGLYPALQFARSGSFDDLKGKVSHFQKGTLRTALVTFQFVLALLFIVASITIYKQLKYVREVNLGFDKENIVYFEKTATLDAHFERFKTLLMQQPAIGHVTQTSDLPVELGMISSDPWWPGKAEGDNTWFKMITVDVGFPETFGVQLSQGRWFSKEFNDTSHYVINEATARYMGLENPVGTKFRAWNGEGQVIGVVKDFHQNSLHQAIEPVVFMYIPDNAEYISLRIEPGKTAEALRSLQSVYASIEPAYPLEYQFLDTHYDSLYKNEQVMAVFANTFSGLAIFISCMGIFGLSVLSAYNRRKEVGIRKVNGARIWEVMLILNMEFLKWVALAFIIACPIAWYAMNQWLQSFAYKTALSWWIFALAGGITLIIALATVSWQSWRAATANPVESLRYE